MIHFGNFWVIPATFVIAFVLVILPLPDWAGPMRPEWVTMVTLYWCLAIPRVFGVGTAWLIGLILDVALGSLLGQHALGLSIISYVACRMHLQIRLSPLGQQTAMISVFLVVKQTLVLWIYGIIGRLPDDLLLYYVPSLMALMLWPWAFIILRDVRRRYRIS